MKPSSLHRITVIALLAAAGILLQLIESFVPVVLIIPGYKIGLANIVGLFALYAYGPKEMVTVTTLRVFIASLATGTLFSAAFILSVSGAVLSMIAMTLCKKSRIFSIYGVSVAGAACHSFGQVLAICWIYQSFFMQLFLPALTALSVISGLLIAWLTSILLRRLMPKEWKQAQQQIGLES